MNAPTALAALTAQAPEPVRLREIPYNYTSLLGPRDRHPPAGDEGLGHPAAAAPGAPDRPLGAHAVRGAGRHLGGAAQPLPAGRPAGQPPAPPPAGARRCSTAWARCKSAAPPTRMPRATRWWASCWRPPRAAVARFDASFQQTAELRRKAPRAGAADGGRQHQVRRPLAREPRDRRDRLARGIPLRGAHPRHRGRDGRAGQGLHRAGPDHHPARGRHGLHRRRHSADLEERGHQHRKARSHDRGGDGAPARRGPPVATVWTEAGVVTQRVADAAERGGYVFAVDPTSPRPRASAATSP
jgi:hypothetical protein